MFYQQLISEVQQFVFRRLEHYFGKRDEAPTVDAFEIPKKKGQALSDLIAEQALPKTEQLVLALALVPHLDPKLFASVIQEFLPQGGDLPIFGGAKGKNHRGIIPTGETAQFLIAGTDIEKRIKVANLLRTSVLIEQNILMMESMPPGEPAMSGKLTVSQEHVDLFLTGKRSAPSFGPDFPAQKIETERSWDDLVLTADVHEQIDELKMWVNHNDQLMQAWQMHKKLKPGYRVLFHGPSGTGKTLTATMLGKHTNREVFRVDLSTIVSKYIGETEKNLEKLFSKAANKDWILFFDEADALFGKRTDVGNAHDRYANQEVSYLLQRVENFGGLVILSTNYKSNIDEAFLRRFNAIIKFPFPDANQRRLIWQKSLPEEVPLEAEVDLGKIASRFELTGGNIINAVHRAALQAISNDGEVITLENVLHGIRREVEKEGKIFQPLPEQHITTNGTQ